MKLKERKSPEQVAYFDTVRRALHDVPRPRRDELLADLKVRLDELPRTTPPVEVLGTGAEYARLAREAAGYGPTEQRPFAYLRSWSRRRKLMTAGAPVVAGIAIFGVVFVTHYQPLVTRNLWTSSTTPMIETDIPVDTMYWRYEPGKLVVIGTELWNHGRATVTVTGVTVPNSFGPFLPSGLRVTHDPHEIGEWQRGVPTERISVHPDEHVYIFVMLKLSRVQLGVGDSESEALPTLKVEVLGVHHLLPIAGSPIGVLNQKPSS